MGNSSPITTRQAGADRLNPGGTSLRLETAVLDWAGTVVDFSSLAPTQTFVGTFAEFGVAVTLDEARGPMGLGKWDYTRTLCNGGAIAARFSLVYDRMPTDDDVTVIYNRFAPLQIEKVGARSAMIPGTLDIIAALREAGLEIDTCSGYPCVVMDRVIDLAAKASYTPDCAVACDEVPRTRPWPAQTLRCVVDLAIGDVAVCVKVDDTVSGIEEGRRAGMWTIVLLMSGNVFGLLYEQYTALSVSERARHRAAVPAGFVACRPHYEIDTIADPPEVVTDIDRRLAHGKRPQCI